MFRYNTLKGAKQNAKNYGYGGARYPWESSITGLENCAVWQYADNEIHISADISYAIDHYFRITGDSDFLYNYALDIVVETSRYFAERVDYNKAQNKYTLNGVMGPDEYQAFTNNNCYTNKMVKFNFASVRTILDSLKSANQSLYDKKIKQLKITDAELKLFAEIENSLPLPYDGSKDLFLQNDDFYNFADLDFNKIWKDRTKPFGHFISQEKNYRSKALKQADVLEMMKLFPEEFTEKQIKSAYDYYEPITTHDSSLSASTHGIIACRMGNSKKALSFLQKTLDIDYSVKTQGAKEGIHIANCGGLWQLVIFGLCGLKIENGELKVKPALSGDITQIDFKIIFKGKKYAATVNKNSGAIEEIN